MTRRSRLGPFAEAGVIIFYLLFAATAIAALGWLVSNVRLVPAAGRAVVLRLGALDRVQGPGLLLAWPAPIDQVALVPAPEQLQEQQIRSLVRNAQARQGDQEETDSASMSDAMAGSGYLLTGDASVVELQVTVFYTIDDAYAYVVERDHIPAALERLVSAAAVGVCASRDLDAVLVARPELIAHDAAAAQLRERLHADLADLVNRRLDALQHGGAGLGIHVQRVDVNATLPRPTLPAFTSVLTSTQTAAEEVAKARTAAENIRQGAQRDAEVLVDSARATAAEQVARAHVETADVLPLHGPFAITDPSLPERDYRAAIQSVLGKAGSVVTVDPNDHSSLILTGPGS